MKHMDELFKKLVEQSGSDLHVSSGRIPMIREHGEMVSLDVPAFTSADVESLFFDIMPDRNREEFQETHDTDFGYSVPALGCRFRCNVFQDRFGIGGVFRVIPSTIVPSEKLNLPKAVTDLCFLPKGLVLVTGPTGSGKSTTMAAMVDLINRTLSAHIITIEDPIEFVHEGKKCLINQREVHNHTGSFSRALRAALREDPNIVLVGEMRDLETIEIAIETAETGHLVFGTLHTNTAAGTVNRIIDAFPADRQNQIRTMLASSLKGVISQTLCRKKPKGRVAALEILIINSAVAAMIRDSKTHQIASAMQIGGAHGMRMLNESLVELVRQGQVEPREAYAKAVDRDDLTTRYRKFNIPTNDLGGDEAVSKGAPEARAPAPAFVGAATAAPLRVVAPPPSVPAPAASAAKPWGKEAVREVAICGQNFLCVPLANADLGDMSGVYVVLDMGTDDGQWRLLDVLQPSDVASEADSRMRVDRWFANCPSRNMWVGVCHLPDGRISPEDRLALENRIRREQGMGSR